MHPFSSAGFGTEPFKFVGYRPTVHPVAGYFLDGSPNPALGFRAGGTCDFCGRAISHAYRFRGADGRELEVGCNCAEIGHAGTGAVWDELRADMRAARRRHGTAERRASPASLARAEMRAEAARARQAEVEAREAERAASAHVGEVGRRLELRLHCVFATCWESAYGLQFLRVYRDQAGNFFKHIGSPSAQPGERVTIRATIKAHEIYQGCKQTVITRPAIIGDKS